MSKATSGGGLYDRRILILDRTPDATETVPWDECRRGDIVIDYLPRRDTSRWVSVDRKRPYSVQIAPSLQTYSWHKTLAAALAAARRLAAKLDRRNRL